MKRMSLKIVSVFILISGCTHLSVTKDLLTSDFLLAKNTKQITFLGDNDHPRFSPDGKRILFQSRGRNTHKGWQIYEIDLENNKERRVTFSDGDAFDATYISRSEILYASTTDEIKERPLTGVDKEFPPSDLYLSDLYGTNILRLTNQPGYDAQPVFLSNRQRPSIIFSSRRGELAGIYRQDLKRMPLSLISAQKGKEKRYPAVSPDQSQLAWVEKDLKTEQESIILYKMKNKIPLALKSGEGTYRDLFFAPQMPPRLFYSILRKGDKYYQIEVYDIQKQCTQVVFKGSDSLFSPVISNENPERVAFSRSFQDKKQIYIVNLPVDLGSCLEPPAQDIVKE